MSKEIYQSFDSASALYALIYRQSDGFIYDAGDEAFEAIGTWNDARADECDIPMTAIGDMHYADFPAVSDGTYQVQIRLQTGAGPSADDPPIAQGIMEWDGTAEKTIGTVLIEQQRVETIEQSTAPAERRPRIVDL